MNAAVDHAADMLRALGLTDYEVIREIWHPDGTLDLDRTMIRRHAPADPGGPSLLSGLPERPVKLGGAARWAATVTGAAADLAALTDGRKLTLASKTYRLGIECPDKRALPLVAQALYQASIDNGLVEDAGAHYVQGVIRDGLRKGWLVGAQQDGVTV